MKNAERIKSSYRKVQKEILSFYLVCIFTMIYLMFITYKNLMWSFDGLGLITVCLFLLYKSGSILINIETYSYFNIEEIIEQMDKDRIEKEIDNSHYLRLKQFVRNEIKQKEEYIKIRSSVTELLWSKCDKDVHSQENTEAFKKFNTHMVQMREHKRKLKNLQNTIKWIKQKSGN